MGNESNNIENNSSNPVLEQILHEYLPDVVGENDKEELFLVLQELLATEHFAIQAIEEYDTNENNPEYTRYYDGIIKTILDYDNPKLDSDTRNRIRAMGNISLSNILIPSLLEKDKELFNSGFNILKLSALSMNEDVKKSGIRGIGNVLSSELLDTKEGVKIFREGVKLLNRNYFINLHVGERNAKVREEILRTLDRVLTPKLFCNYGEIYLSAYPCITSSFRYDEDSDEVRELAEKMREKIDMLISKYSEDYYRRKLGI